ncbi:AI-2E family transporter [Archangium violaceum]|uniref:AI-2E family transporter n=1 Tax=Archangium violaceum TaxID=83451 RepID=UPI00193B2D02|nr:AI-2E family transporter [Archangium violaceum]QRK04758.1 AI-2E family transporter [Archangium violaceum]
MNRVHPNLEAAARFSGRCLLIAGLVFVLGYIVSRLPLVFLSVFVALLFTSLLLPVADWLARHRVPRSLAALAAVLLAVALLGGLLSWIIPKTASELSANADTLIQRVQSLARSLMRFLPGEQPSLDELGGRAEQWVRQHSRTLTLGAASGAATLLSVLSGMLLTLVLTFFFVRDGSTLVRAALSPLSPERRRLAGAAVGRAWRTLKRWVRGTVVVALIDAVGIGAGLLILGVPLALPIALLTFLSAFVPVVGAVFAGAVAVLVAWATQGTRDALITFGIALAVQQLEGNVLQPMVMGRILPLHPAVVLLAVTTGALVAGLAGAFVAVPLLAALTAGGQALLGEGREPPRSDDTSAEEPEDLDDQLPAHH